MVSRRITTERAMRFSTCATLTTAIVLVLSGIAHAGEAKVSRSLVRLQGHLVQDSAEAKTADEIVLNARGIERRFRVSDRRRFELAQAAVTPPRERDRLTLQGDFDVLARFAKARPDQQVTILGEQRPGSGDLFILTLDLCPP